MGILRRLLGWQKKLSPTQTPTAGPDLGEAISPAANVQHAHSQQVRGTISVEKICALCGATFEQGVITCPKCGRGLLEITKKARDLEPAVGEAIPPEGNVQHAPDQARAKHEHFLEERDLKITELPKYHDEIMHRVLALRKFSDSISFVNDNIVVRCPKCGLVYNSEGFEVGYLAALAFNDTPTTFSSGGQGMYGRASRGLCPNPNCTSTTAIVEWRGGELGSEQSIPDKAAKSSVVPPSQSTDNASALVLLGKKYLIGEEVPQDFQKALKHFRLAADMGNADAQFFLGNMHDKGYGVAQEYKEALKWYRLAADQGHASAQFCVGVFHRDGFGVPQDYYEAAKWTRLAAEQGHDEAQFNMGVMYYRGLGVAQNIQESAMWWRRAADQGNANAKHNLSLIE